MANVGHKALTGAQIHEPKGADTANAGTVYVADGLGAGSFTIPMRWIEVEVAATDLDSAGSKVLIDSAASEQYKIREVFLIPGTNFGAGGDRNVSITDGTSTWSVITNALIESQAITRWGDTGVPYPATAAHFNTASAAGVDISASYSGGATDHSGTGTFTLLIGYERTA